MAFKRVGWTMDNEQKECPMCGMQTEADRMGLTWAMVDQLSEKESVLVELVDPSITLILKRHTESQ